MPLAQDSVDYGCSVSSRAIPETSIRAMLGDVEHVVGKTDPSTWPEIASELLEHHSPPIDDVLLPPKARKLQQWLRAMLEAMIDVDEDGVRAAAIKVQQYS